MYYLYQYWVTGNLRQAGCVFIGLVVYGKINSITNTMYAFEPLLYYPGKMHSNHFDPINQFNVE